MFGDLKIFFLMIFGIKTPISNYAGGIVHSRKYWERGILIEIKKGDKSKFKWIRVTELDYNKYGVSSIIQEE